MSNELNGTLNYFRIIHCKARKEWRVASDSCLLIWGHCHVQLTVVRLVGTIPYNPKALEDAMQDGKKKVEYHPR